MAKKKDFYNQSISGEDVELLAQFTGKLDKVLHNKRVSYLRKKNQKETKEVSFEANASYLEGVFASYPCDCISRNDSDIQGLIFS